MGNEGVCQISNAGLGVSRDPPLDCVTQDGFSSFFFLLETEPSQ